jgi:two-component system sensor histidine kinase CssS
MFKPFEKGTDGQFGLGLSIVHRIVTAYDCEVYAYNSYDGVVFKVAKKNPVKQEQKKKEEKKNKESKKKKTEEKLG